MADEGREFALPVTGLDNVLANRRGNDGSGAGGLQGVNRPVGLSHGPAPWRTVQRNELASTQLTQGLQRGGSYLTGARGRGQRAAAARGGFNTDLAGAQAEQVAIDSYAPIAMADAATYDRAASDNQARINESEIAFLEQTANNAQAQMSVYASQVERQHRARTAQEEADRDRAWRTGERTGSQEFDRGERREDRDFNRTERQADREYNTNERREIQDYDDDRALFDRYLADPDLWSNPAALEGLRNLRDRIFGRSSTRSSSGSLPKPAKAGVSTAAPRPSSAVTTTGAGGTAPKPPGGYMGNTTPGRTRANRPQEAPSRFNYRNRRR